MRNVPAGFMMKMAAAQQSGEELSPCLEAAGSVVGLPKEYARQLVYAKGDTLKEVLKNIAEKYAKILEIDCHEANEAVKLGTQQIDNILCKVGYSGDLLGHTDCDHLTAAIQNEVLE